MPTRIGGLDQIAANRRSSGTSSGVQAWKSASPSVAALCRARSSARWLTSTAQTEAPGESSASVSAIGPQPQPRSSSRAGGRGAGACCEQHRGADVEPVGAEDARSGLHADPVPGQRDVQRAALGGAGRLGGEVVVGLLAHHRTRYPRRE